MATVRRIPGRDAVAVVEYSLGKEEAESSIPSGSTIPCNENRQDTWGFSAAIRFPRWTIAAERRMNTIRHAHRSGANLVQWFATRSRERWHGEAE